MLGKKVMAKVVLMEKNAIDHKVTGSTAINKIQDFPGNKVEFCLICSTAGDPDKECRGLVGPAAYLEPNVLPVSPTVAAGETTYVVTFIVDHSQGIPGAVIIKNHHQAHFYLKSITIESFPGKGRIYFDCNSWVYNSDKYTYDRIFFANNSYLPKNTPESLRAYRKDELRNLRGDDVKRELKEWDRVYNYALYNDLGAPDSSPLLARPVLGGSVALPYPRRGMTGRSPAKTDSKTEGQLSELESDIYVPRDERFSGPRSAYILSCNIKAVARDLLPMLLAVIESTTNEFDSFKEVLDLYVGAELSSGSKASQA